MFSAIQSFFAKLFGAKSGTAAEPEIWNFILKGDRREIGAINEALERAAGAGGVPEAAFRQMQVALDELLTNAVSYGEVSPQTPAKVDILVSIDSVRAVLRYKDINFNPFTQSARPDLDANIKDREIGGLGVHLVKEMMDEYGHQYDDGHNIIVVGKKF
jgi:anti-sigma regulatory factor (Ser/Thr protein kinase)